MEEKTSTMEAEKIHFSSLPSAQMAYFIKNYWDKRDYIFNELYSILYGKKPPIQEKIIKKSRENDPEDDLTDIKFYDLHPEYFNLFDDTDFRASFYLFDDKSKREIKIENENKNENNKNNNEYDGENNNENNDESNSGINNNIDENNDNNDEINNNIDENNDNNDEINNNIDENNDNDDGINNNNGENNDKKNDNNDESNYNNEKKNDDDFMTKTKNIIYENYLKNYKERNYKFKNKDFSLSCKANKVIYFQIKNIDVFKIDYLIIIKINDNSYEWVCNSTYGLYLLTKIKGFKKPYPIYPDNDDDIEIKTISNTGDFDDLMSKGIKEFEDLNYEIDLEGIFKNINKILNFQFLKKVREINQIMNLNDQDSEIEDFDLLKKLFEQKKTIEAYTYIYGSKNYITADLIINTLINIYNDNNGRFLYLDLEYMSKLKSRNDLKKYLAFWLLKAFGKDDFDLENYKSIYTSIIESIDYRQYDLIIKILIEFYHKIYNKERLFIILNNVKGEINHNDINNIKTSIKVESFYYKFIIFCDIEDEYNLKKLDEIYKTKGIKLILIPDLIFNESLIDATKEINNLFAEYNTNKFVDLIKIFNFSSFLDYNSEKKEDFQELPLIIKYIKFFNLIVDNDLNESKPFIKNIEFKNKEIENQFLKQYSAYFVSLLESDEKLQEILNLNDGDFFEKLIILDIITEKIKEKNDNYNFVTLEVNSLFGLDLKNFDFEKYKGKNILFTQKSKTAEIFDFGILINKDGQIIMKLYQISTKKTKGDLAKLDIDIIKLHCINIQKNLEVLGKINKFSFGIITSNRCFEKNKKDFELMKEDCNSKNYELLIYNIKEKKFYIEADEPKNNGLLNLANIYSINKVNQLELPNYEKFFRLKPVLKSMKYINKNYRYCIEKYYNNNDEFNDIKIIGKIEYDKSIINSSISDNNLGLLISGYIPGKKYDTEKMLYVPFSGNDIKYRMVKEDGKNQIYKKAPNTKGIIEINKLDAKVINFHLLLYKHKKKKLLGNKRNPEQLFLEDIITNKKKK